MHSLAEVSFGLTHQLTDEKHIRGGAITNDVILGSGSTANHGSGGVLDLLYKNYVKICRFNQGSFVPSRGEAHFRPW
jgi:hypothetical protein